VELPPCTTTYSDRLWKYGTNASSDHVCAEVAGGRSAPRAVYKRRRRGEYRDSWQRSCVIAVRVSRSGKRGRLPQHPTTGQICFHLEFSFAFQHLWSVTFVSAKYARWSLAPGPSLKYFVQSFVRLEKKSMKWTLPTVDRMISIRILCYALAHRFHDWRSRNPILAVFQHAGLWDKTVNQPKVMLSNRSLHVVLPLAQRSMLLLDVSCRCSCLKLEYYWGIWVWEILFIEMERSDDLLFFGNFARKVFKTQNCCQAPPDELLFLCHVPMGA